LSANGFCEPAAGVAQLVEHLFRKLNRALILLHLPDGGAGYHDRLIPPKTASFGFELQQSCNKSCNTKMRLID
jgi:hypothetical protein